MANHYSLQTTLIVDSLYGLAVQASDQIPQNIAMWRLEQDAALANSELGLGHDGMYSWVLGVLDEGVLIFSSHL
jgi:hypothetical protein